MLKIDNKICERFFPNLTPKFEFITPFKTFRFYMYEDNKFIGIETNGGEGEMERKLKEIMEMDIIYYIKTVKYPNHTIHICEIIS